MTSLTKEACAPLGVKPRDADRSKNFFALGPHLVDVHPARAADHRLDLREVRQAGPWSATPTWPPSAPGTPSARPPSCSTTPTRCKPAPQQPGVYTNITGNTALAWGLVAAGQLAQLPVFLGSYPITPASDILHELSKHKNFGVRTLQAEDEIAGIGAALGASFGGHLGVTTTSGPGVALKSETIGLAISLELPLLIIDIQRGGPSTGLPTKTEQSDLLLAMYGRHGESPLPIVAALQPVQLLRRRHRGGPHRADLPHAGDPAVRRLPGQRLRALAAARRRRPRAHQVTFATEPNHVGADGEPEFWPYLRDPETLARPVGAARHAGADAPHRRHREGRRQRQHQLRPGQPRAHGRPAGGQDRRHRQRPPARRGRRRRRRRRRAPRASAGARRGAPSAAPSTGSAAGAARWPRSTSCTSTRSRPTWARCSPATPRCSSPR